ncbi:hypothetical protein L9F63_003860 [Diploptera punctata]|uniref:WD repeat-containing protein 55 homolog n=1 Tax=Diploptera punctata TaxID=6984 RepID=A0AAD7ZK07_DIPPU|nr:hypothetical protein L9F63_003860 [Diploptera punctata]
MCKIKKMSDNEEIVESSSDSDESINSDITDSDDDSIENGGAPTEDPNTGGEGREEEEDDDDDELVKAIRKEREKCSEHPPDIQMEDYIVDISFSPSSNIIAAATITGDVVLYKYSNESNEILNSLELHTKACRDIEFSKDGDILFSSSKDKSIMLTDVNTGKLKNFYDNAHEDPIYCLLV